MWPQALETIEDLTVTRIVVPAQQAVHPLEISFEEAAERLSALPRLFLEPDGSFVWVGDDSQKHRWQIDGVLWDGGHRLHHVELKGCCPGTAFDQLLHALHADPPTLLVLFMRQAVWLEVQEFKQFWCDAQGASLSSAPRNTNARSA
jgi:hypothetical protein